MKFGRVENRVRGLGCGVFRKESKTMYERVPDKGEDDMNL